MRRFAVTRWATLASSRALRDRYRERGAVSGVTIVKAGGQYRNSLATCGQLLYLRLVSLVKKGAYMKTSLGVILCAAAALSTASVAYASGGCGVGRHRAPNGGCYPNGGGVVVAPGLALGVFYPGRGYWDGHRYWGHRYAWHGGWRYR